MKTFKTKVYISIITAIAALIVIYSFYTNPPKDQNKINEMIGFIFLALLAGVSLLFKKKEYMFGFKHNGIFDQRGLFKNYEKNSAMIFHWGSSDSFADGNDYYLGIYVII